MLSATSFGTRGSQVQILPSSPAPPIAPPIHRGTLCEPACPILKSYSIEQLVLRATGGSRHGETDLVEGPENFEPRLADDLRQSVGVGAVAVVAGLHDVGMP